MSERESLLAMGYQEFEPRRWVKPVGYHMLSYDEVSHRWRNWYRAVDEDALLVYESHVWEDTLQVYGSELGPLGLLNGLCGGPRIVAVYEEVGLVRFEKRA